MAKHTQTINKIPAYLKKLLSLEDNAIRLEQERVKEFSNRKKPLTGDRKVILPWSGGLDSTSSLLMALESGCYVTTVSFNYGQEYVEKEKQAINTIKSLVLKNYPQAKELWKEQYFIDISWLDCTVKKIMGGTWDYIFPLRNYFILKEASKLSCKKTYDELWFSCIQGEIPYSGGDKSIVFLSELQKEMVKKNIILITPLIGLNKADIVRWANQKKERWKVIKKTLSCFTGSGKGQCGKCQACFNRLVGFATAGKIKNVGFEPQYENLKPFVHKYEKVFNKEKYYSDSRKADINIIINLLKKNG